MMTQIKNNKGFSLIELMVALGILSMVIGGIYAAYRSQLRTQITQEQVVDMQQTMRGAMTILQKEIRMAGYDPEGTDNAGFINGFPTSGATVGATSLALAFDDDDDGAVELNDMETVAYRLWNNALERYFNSTGTWEVLADNIDALSFVYLDGDGNVIDDDGAGNVTTSLNLIRSIEITMVGRAGANVAVMSTRHTDSRTYQNRQGTVVFDRAATPDNFRRQILTAEVVCRNMLME